MKCKTTLLLALVPILAVLLSSIEADGLHSCESVFPYLLDAGMFVLAPTPPNTTSGFYWQKICKGHGTSPPALVPNADTFIVIHGLQSGYTETWQQFGDIEEVLKLAMLVRTRVTNVMLFRWTQLSDEELENFERAEAKIYSTSAFNGMQYLYYDRSASHDSSPKWADATGKDRISVADRFARDYFDIFNVANGWDPALLNVGYEIRVIGHSLGSQVAAAGSFRIMYPSNFSTHLVPDGFPDDYVGVSRITLLDPVFSVGNRRYFVNDGKNSGQHGSDIMSVLSNYIELLLEQNGIPTEHYKTSHISNCEGRRTSHVPILRSVAYCRVKMLEWGDIKPGNCVSPQMFKGNFVENYKELAVQSIMTHIYAVGYYLQSIVYPPHQCIPAHDHKECQAEDILSLSASMDTPTVRYYAQSVFDDIGKACFVQFNDSKNKTFAGVMDHTPENDLFYLQSCTKVHF